MLSADGIVLVLMLVACALVVLGTLELMWPTRPRHPVRHSARAAEVRRRTEARLARRAPLRVAPAVPMDPVPPEAPVPVSAPVTAAEAPEPTDDAPPVRDVAPAPAEVLPPVEAPPAGDSPVDRGLALVQAGRFAEAAALGRQALDARKAGRPPVPTPDAARETARLWGLIGVARQGLGELDDARFAFEEAIAGAPSAERPQWERHLAGLALEVGRRALADTEAAPAQRVEALRSAIEWLDRGLAACPDDAALPGARADMQDALWVTVETAASGHLTGKAFAETRRLAEDALADPECPADGKATFAALLVRALTGQARGATADALRHRVAGRTEESAAALDRAEHLLTPLYLAWSLARGDAEHARAVTTSLTCALDEIVDARADEVDALIDAGDLALARARGDKLRSALRGAAGQGLSPDDLGYATSRVEALFDRMRDPGPE